MSAQAHVYCKPKQAGACGEAVSAKCHRGQQITIDCSHQASLSVSTYQRKGSGICIIMTVIKQQWGLVLDKHI